MSSQLLKKLEMERRSRRSQRSLKDYNKHIKTTKRYITKKLNNQWSKRFLNGSKTREERMFFDETEKNFEH